MAGYSDGEMAPCPGWDLRGPIAILIIDSGINMELPIFWTVGDL